jgi:hypothetical protein
MSTSEKRDPHLSSRSQAGNNRISLIRRKAGLLALAILGTLLSAKIWVPVAFFLVDTFPANPALAGTILSVICVVFFLCIPGARMRSRLISAVSRAVVLFLSVVAAIASMETISVGLVSVTMTPSREGFLWVSIAIVLVAFAALGIKAALDWRLSYWILFPAVFATLLVATFGTTIVSLM